MSEFFGLLGMDGDEEEVEVSATSILVIISKLVDYAKSKSKLTTEVTVNDKIY